MIKRRPVPLIVQRLIPERATELQPLVRANKATMKATVQTRPKKKRTSMRAGLKNEKAMSSNRPHKAAGKTRHPQKSVSLHHSQLSLKNECAQKSLYLSRVEVLHNQNSLPNAISIQFLRVWSVRRVTTGRVLSLARERRSPPMGQHP